MSEFVLSVLMTVTLFTMGVASIVAFRKWLVEPSRKNAPIGLLGVAIFARVVSTIATSGIDLAGAGTLEILRDGFLPFVIAVLFLLHIETKE